jgi:guanosine-3',5'-bis(diphosphate) 3'-pyrophosphohydrolase
MLNLHWIGGVKDEEMLIAALCHDLLEETATQPDDLKVRFGKRVYDLVFELTRIEPLVEANWSKDRIWLVSADALLAEVTKMSPDAQVIKLADRLANTNEAHRFRTGKGLERYLWQSTRIMDAIPREQNPALWDALHTAIKR